MRQPPARVSLLLLTIGNKAKEGVLIRHHVVPRKDGYAPTKDSTDSPVLAQIDRHAVVVVNLDTSGRTSIEKSWDWKSGRFDSGLGDKLWTGTTTFKIQNKKKRGKVSFLSKPQVREIPAEGEGWKRIPSPSTRINRYKTAEDCPKEDPEDLAYAQATAKDLSIAVSNHLKGLKVKCKYRCDRASTVVAQQKKPLKHPLARQQLHWKLLPIPVVKKTSSASTAAECTSQRSRKPKPKIPFTPNSKWSHLG